MWDAACRCFRLRSGAGVVAEIRFCSAPDGARIAYAMHGRGPPLVRVATWLTHLELDWNSPVWRHWLDRLGERHTVLRYDERGCGLSDAAVGELSVETWVGDLEAVVDAAGWNASRCSASRRGRRSRWRTPRGTRRGSLISSSTAATRAAGGCVGRTRRKRRWSRRSAPGGRLRGPSVPPRVQHALSAPRHFRADGLVRRSAPYDRLAEAAVQLFQARGGVDVVATRAHRYGQDAGDSCAWRSCRAGRGGSAARLADPGCASGGARLREPHPARRRAGVGAVGPPDERLPGHVRGCCVSRASASATSVRASWKCSSSWPRA